jgi:putative hemolysin
MSFTHAARLARAAALPVALLAILVAPGPLPAGAQADPVTLGLYCAQAGGNVHVRYPVYGTNSAAPLRLAGERHFCEFTGEDGSSIVIAVAVDTLAAAAPTLAALAYLNPPPLEPGPPSANPSSRYCSQLGGTDLFGGVTAAGGGWVLEDDPGALPLPAAPSAGDVIAMCVFPDLSTIDSWGLTYHSSGIVRGADLEPLLRYQPGPGQN